MSIEHILQEFGTRSGLGPLGRDAKGLCRLVVDGDLVVDIEAADGQSDAVMTAMIAPIAPGAGSAVLRQLLTMNLGVADNGGASLALDGGRDEIVLCRVLPIEDLTYLSFERALQTFIDHAGRCRTYLESEASMPVAAMERIGAEADIVFRA